jgi:hypothetical protein
VAQTPLQITTTSVQDGVVSKAYSFTLTAAGGTAPYTWSLFGGSLPPGFTLSGAGVISGTPTRNGDFSFTVRVTDSAAIPASVTQALAMTVALPLSIVTDTLPNGGVQATYPAQTLATAGGKAPYVWAVSSGSLPNGLALSAAGVISGTATASGPYSFAVTVTDSANPAQATSKTLSILIQPPPVINTASPLPVAVVGVFYMLQLEEFFLRALV